MPASPPPGFANGLIIVVAALRVWNDIKIDAPPAEDPPDDPSQGRR